MPTYEYKCKHCGHRFEELQSITADSLRICPECGNNGLERLIGAGAGVIFKGQGFYTTDYRGSSSKPTSEKASSDSGSSSSSDKAEKVSD
jgi:putative FmdB family regulatory protein